ncbi:probable basic-leucine zipper transcription factor R [Teleopsis dalmanni]|uniref:probable basic-leucine zipper transcription factor R n=1 Tax=Teleopsis dalmanni TaxID=139649 RepID=UPI0018CFCB2B|nr:probable basic-leucine zipper transcription factor R [Teleopsis dalmanni]
MSPARVSSPLTLSTSQQQQPQTSSTPSHHLSSILNETANSNDSSTLAVAANNSNNSNNSSSNSSTNSIVNNQPTMPLQNTMRLISMTPVRVEDIYSLGPVSPVRNQQQSNQQHNQSIDKQTTAEVNKIATSKTASLSKPSIIQSTQCQIYPDKHSVKLRENLQEQAPCKCLVPPSHDPKANKEIQEFQIPEAQRQQNLKHIEENPKVFSLQRYTQDHQESQTQIHQAQRQPRPRYNKQNPEVFHPIQVIPDQVQAHEIQPQQVPQNVTPIEENKPGLSKHRISNTYSIQDHVNLQLQIQDVQQPREQKRQIEEHDLSSRPTLPQRLTIIPESSHVNHSLLPTSTSSESNFKSSSQTILCHSHSNFKSSLQPKELEPQPPYPVNQQQAPREAPPRDNYQSGPSSSSSSTTSPQRNSTTVQPVSNNRHVQPTNSLDPLDINVLDSKLNMELSSQETQAKDKVKRDSQQEPWSPQEEWNVVQPSKKGNKPETLVRRLDTFKRKDDHHHVKNQDDYYKIYKSPKKRKRNRASF